jgi:hypothetical protein
MAKFVKKSWSNKNKRKSPRRRLKKRLIISKARPKFCLKIVLPWVIFKEKYQMHSKSSKMIKG